MQIDERKLGDVTILDLKGKLTLGDGDELLRSKINGLVQAGAKRIVLNLGEVVRSYTTVKKHEGVLKLLNLTKRIQDLLAITKLLTVFDTFDSEADAVTSFGA